MTVRLMHGDCLELMAQIPDGSVDMILCDLPYGTTACKWDTVIPFEPLWAQYRRIAKRNAAIVLTASQPFTTALIASNMRDFRYTWVWDKKLSSGALNAAHRPMKRHEDVCVFSQDRCVYYPDMRTGIMRIKGGGKASQCYGKVVPTKSLSDQYFPTSILEFSNANQRNKVHPTQKPVALMEYLIRTYTREGETVLDNCMGSGTTGVACVNTGRSFIGIERDETYFIVASDRITSASTPEAQTCLPLDAGRGVA